jgi:ATP-dependent RNA helicase MSS116
MDGVRETLTSNLFAAGVTALTPIQAGCLPHALAGSDILAKAKTGTGKTFAFLLPTAERLLRCSRNVEAGLSSIDHVRSLILSSARELGTQIAVQANKLTEGTGLKVDTIMGGSSIVPQRERLDPKLVGSSCSYGGAIDILIATPGRLIEHIHTTDGFAARLAGVETLVLDECDMLLDGGFQRDIEEIFGVLKGERQTLCFSATVPKKMLAVVSLALKEDHVVVDCVGEEKATHAAVTQRAVVHPLGESLLALYSSIKAHMASHPEEYKILAFLPTARQTQFSAAVFAELGLSVLEIHSRRSASERTHASDTFRDGKRHVLFTSDVSARGVDYPDVSLVLQVGSPGGKDVYVQRVGRTGRAGRSGEGLLLLCQYEASFLKQLEGLPIEESKWAGSLDSQALEELTRLQAAASRVDAGLATQTYRAWLQAMNNMRKSLQWDKPALVRNANLYARKVLGRAETPTVTRESAVSMGLASTPGLVLTEEAAPPAAPPEEPQGKLEVTFDYKALGAGLRRDAMAAKGALLTLSEEALLAVQARLEADPSTPQMVGGFPIAAGIFTASYVKPLPCNVSAASLASSGGASGGVNGGASGGASSRDISRNTSSLSLASTDDAATGALPAALGLSPAAPPAEEKPAVNKKTAAKAAKLEKDMAALQNLLDIGRITPAEYDEKKAKAMSK